ncbi:MAG: QueT transporter family protein [Pseudobutyrivibrio sp.]|nr:QueT transporter family protein [Pseudobutyrivibrio sp.]
MMNKKTLFITQAAMIAAIYVVLTLTVNAFGLASGAIQVRISEALCVLPVFTPAAIPGLFLGCLISNTLSGCVILDIIFGSLATLLGAIGAYLLRKTRFIFTLPPVLANAIVVPFVLKYAYGLQDAFLYLVITVGIGEIISICVIGMILKSVLWKQRGFIFRQE